jgi:DNA helicase-2/ATP-dependent DNA helicase PcrA
MEEEIFPSGRSIMKPDELEEERRLAYVAITRAKDRLFMIHTRERLFYGKQMYNPPSRFISEIDEEYKNDEVAKEKARAKAEISEKPRKARVSEELFTRSAAVSNVRRPRPAGEALCAGDRVKHMIFGEGTVISAEAMGSDILYQIAFDTVGTKKFMGTYAKLTKI